MVHLGRPLQRGAGLPLPARSSRTSRSAPARALPRTRTVSVLRPATPLVAPAPSPSAEPRSDRRAAATRDRSPSRADERRTQSPRTRPRCRPRRLSSAEAQGRSWRLVVVCADRAQENLTARSHRSQARFHELVFLRRAHTVPTCERTHGATPTPSNPLRALARRRGLTSAICVYNQKQGGARQMPTKKKAPAKKKTAKKPAKKATKKTVKKATKKPAKRKK